MTENQFIICTLVVTNVATYLTARTLLKALENEQRRYKTIHEAGSYLLSILEDRGVDLTEFDIIALSALTEENNAT